VVIRLRSGGLVSQGLCAGLAALVVLLGACSLSPGQESAGGGRAPAGQVHSYGGAVATGSPRSYAPANGGSRRPNIVFISTDDERTSDMKWMPYTRRLIGGNGVTFSEALSPHPLCCPARAEFVTGQYGQNNGVTYNRGVHGGYQALRDPGNTLARWLHDAGYQTGMAGKYLNQYSPDRPSRTGWDHWNPSVRGVYSYNHTTFYNDGHQVLRRAHVDHAVTGYVNSYIHEFARKKAPFYVWASDLAPHGRLTGGHSTEREGTNPLPAKRDRGTMADVVNPATSKPSYGVGVRHGMEGRFTTPHLLGPVMNRKFETRIESLQAADRGVRSIVNTLKSTGEWSNTYIVFTSDNGYMLGEHGLIEKNYLFDEALRVPLLVRVPGAEPTTSRLPVTSVDIAPTVADLAGVTPERVVDGTSFAPLLSGASVSWRDTQLVQTGRRARSWSDQGWKSRGVRTSRWTYGYSARSGQAELYDRVNDPFELVNLAEDPADRAVRAELARRARLLENCAGADCQHRFGPVPDPHAG
jgi:N-acetylglucosamine-6-sulfatase